MPFSGPFVTVEQTGTVPGALYKRSRSRYRQNAPYLEPLPYQTVVQRNTPILPQGQSLWDDGSFTSDAAIFGSSLQALAHAKAYGRFRESLGEEVNLAVNLAERKQAIDMMASRLAQLYRFSRNLARFRFREAAQDLGLEVTSHMSQRDRVLMTIRKRDGTSRELRLKRRASAYGKNYLEYHFGWEPLVKDVGSAIEMSHSVTFPDLGRRVSSRATELGSKPPSPSLAWGQTATRSAFLRASVQLSAYIKISDPNLLRLNQLGFTNPAVVAWELVPFSFVADWFANVGQVLASYTDFIGLDLNWPRTSVLIDYVETRYYRGGVYPTTVPYVERTRFGMQRIVGISGPSLVLRPPKLPSVTRAATACSLLVQFLNTRK